MDGAATSSLPVPFSPVMSTVRPRRRRRLDQQLQLAHARAERQDVAEAGAALVQQPHQAAVLEGQASPLAGLVEQRQQRVGIDRLLDVVERPRGDGVHGPGDGPVAGHDDRVRIRPASLELAEQLDAVHVGQHDVDDGDRRLGLGTGGQCLLAV